MFGSKYGPRKSIATAFQPSQFDGAPGELRKRFKIHKVANNTYRWIDPETGDTHFRLHETDIVTLHADGTTTLRTGGFKTDTTKDRMNRFMPKGYHITRCNGIWWVNSVPFQDGMVLPKNPDDLNKTVTKADTRQAIHDENAKRTELQQVALNVMTNDDPVHNAIYHNALTYAGHPPENHVFWGRSLRDAKPGTIRKSRTYQLVRRYLYVQNGLSA